VLESTSLAEGQLPGGLGDLLREVIDGLQVVGGVILTLPARQEEYASDGGRDGAAQHFECLCGHQFVTDLALLGVVVAGQHHVGHDQHAVE